MESKVEDTSTFSALPQEEQQELEQTLSQNSKHLSPLSRVAPAFNIACCAACVWLWHAIVLCPVHCLSMANDNMQHIAGSALEA